MIPPSQNPKSVTAPVLGRGDRGSTCPRKGGLGGPREGGSTYPATPAVPAPPALHSFLMLQHYDGVETCAADWYSICGRLY